MFFPSAVGGHSNLMLSWHVLTWGMYSGEIDIKISMILMDHPLSQKYIWLYFQLLTGRTVLRAFWESSSCINIISSVAQLCPTLCNPMNCSTPGFPVLTNSWSLLKLMSIALVMPSNHILCHPLFLLPSIFPRIRVFLNESVLCIRWPKYQSFSFSISPSNEYSGLISFKIHWFDLLVVQGTL